MSKKSLTDMVIKKMKTGRLTDTDENRGLIVKKSKLGKTSFFYRYEEFGTKKGSEVKIGDYPNMSLAEARLELQNLKALRKSGLSPKQEIKNRKIKDLEEAQHQHSLSFTMNDMVEFYLTNYIEDRKVNGKEIKGARKPKGQYEVRKTLRLCIVKEIGNIAVTEITVSDIMKAIQKVLDRGSNVQAGTAVYELNSAFEYAIGMGKLSDDFMNPVAAVKRKLKLSRQRLTPIKGTRVLSDIELAKFLHWLPDSHFLDNPKYIFMLTLYTGCRTGEWCNAKWSDIDFNNKTFHIVLTKTETNRYVQLSEQAINLLSIIRENSTTEYLFVSSRTGKPLLQKKLSEYMWRLRERNQMIDIPAWSPHDLRRTVRTGLAKLQCPKEVAEAVLGHSKKGIEGTYDLHRYDDESREWLQQWCNHLDGLKVNS
ncbi:MAG: tyrosine-type recombinase/integrase [Wohlfahrtiimonas sp.]